MPRPVNCRRVAQGPCVARFKPAGRPCSALETVTMSLDEFEAVRLTDLDGLYQADAAARMGVSRPTLSRIIDSAHNKIARMLVMGLELRIEGGYVTRDDVGFHRCARTGEGGTPCPRCRRAASVDNVELNTPECHPAKGEDK